MCQDTALFNYSAQHTYITFNLTRNAFVWLVAYSFSLQGQQIKSSKQKMFY